MARALRSPGSLTVRAGDGAPAGNGARGPGRVALGGQVDLPHSRGQLGRLAQLHQHDVILVGLRGVAGVDERLCGLDLLASPTVQPKTAHVHVVVTGRGERPSERGPAPERGGGGPETGELGCRDEGTGTHALHLAVGGGDHPLLVDQDASAVQLIAFEQGHLPGVGGSGTGNAIDNPVPRVLSWRERRGAHGRCASRLRNQEG